jgi:putative oxidoreductase
MDTILGGFAPQAYAILRIVSGLLFALHGSQKLLGWPGDRATVPFATLLGAAGVIELVGGVLIAVGVMTGLAAFIASGEMAFAYFMSHAPRGYLPILNQGEITVVYCFLFLYIATQGAGVWSVQGSRPRGRR